MRPVRFADARTLTAARPGRSASGRRPLAVLTLALLTGLGGTPTALAAPTTGWEGHAQADQAPGTVTLTVEGTVQHAVVDRPHGATDDAGHADETEHADGGLVLDTMVQVDGELYDVPDAVAPDPGDGPADVRSGDPVTITLAAQPDVDGTEALEAAGTGDDATARVLDVDAAPTSAPATGPSSPRTPDAPFLQPSVRTAPMLMAPAITSVVGTHPLTVLPVHWGGSTYGLPTRAALTTLASDAATYWSEQSGGEVAVRPTVRDWLTIPDPGRCDHGAIMRDALEAHRVSSPTGNAHVAVYFPERTDCGGWAGMGSIRGGHIWINGVPTVDVLAHELGHNLGLGHANTATCRSAGARVSLSAECSISPYADLADVMGFGTTMATGNLNTALADQLGLASVLEVSQLPATVDIARLADVGSARGVRLATAFGTVYVDFRPAQGRDVRRPAWAGVQVHRLVDSTGYPESQLLDMQPTTRTAFSATSLPVGGAWDIPGSGQTLSVVATGTTTARLSLTRTGAAAPTPSPTPSSTPTPTPTDPPPPSAGGDLTFVPITPTRLLDTRDAGTPLGPRTALTLEVAGTRAVPAEARAVALNVTAVGATARTHLRAWPGGGAMPNSSVLNTDPTRTVATGVMLGTGTDGTVRLYNDAGQVHLVADVTGYYVPTGGAGFQSVAPLRVLDTRVDGPAGGVVASGTGRTVTLAGRYVPADATAVVVNVTSVNPGAAGYLVAYPAGSTRPLASTVNHLPGAAATNRAAVRLGDGALTVHLEGGAGHVVVDLVGWFGPTAGGRFTPVPPVRAFDTRTTGRPLEAAELRTFDVRGAAGVPAAARTAVMVLTATGSTAPATYTTAWDGTGTRPPTSDLNVRQGVDGSNLLVVPWSSAGAVHLYNHLGSVHVVGDVYGYFS